MTLILSYFIIKIKLFHKLVVVSTTTNLFYSTIFKTFDSDIEKASAKIGVFGKSFNEIFEARNKRRLDIDNLMNYEGKTLKEAKKDVDSFWSYLYQKKESFDWKETASGAIVTADNIDDFIPEITPDKAEGMLQQIAAIDKAKGSWNDYFKELQNNNQGCIVDLIKNTDDLSKLTGDDLVEANRKARQGAIAHNAALKQQTMGAKAAKFAMNALSTVGNMVVFTLISQGISKLMNAEAEALEKAQESYEKAVGEVEKLNEREDVALSSAKELSDLFSDENWGVASAQKASEIYSQMADQLEEIGGAEDDRIQQLRDEAEQIRNNIGLSKQERDKKAEEERKKAIGGWNKESNITKYKDKVNSFKDAMWATVEDEFSDVFNLAGNGSVDVEVYALEGDVLDRVGTADKLTGVSKEVYDVMKDFLAVGVTGQEYVTLGKYGEDDESQKKAMVEFMEQFKKLQDIKDVSDNELYKSIKAVYNLLEEPYSNMKSAQSDLNIQKAKKDAYSYFEDNGFAINSEEDEANLTKFLKNQGHTNNSIKKVTEALREGGFYTEEYSKEAERNANLASGLDVSLSTLEDAIDKIKPLGSAFKELSSDGYISIDTLKAIQEQTGLTGDEWSRYQTKLMNAKVGSAEYNQVMSELTYKLLDQAFATQNLENLTEEQVAATLRENGVTNASAVAHDWLAKAKAKEKIATMDIIAGIELSKDVLMDEADACGITAEAYLELVAKEIIFSRNELDVTDKLAKLQSIYGMLGLVGDKWATLNAGLKGDTFMSGAALINAGIYKREGAGRQYEWVYNGATYASEEEAVQAYMNDQVTKDIVTKDLLTDYSGASNKSGTEKNEALEKHLKDAERRYKIHQDETEYINDLVHAYKALAKTDEERLDITDKINEAYKNLADNRIKDLEHQIDLVKELHGEDTDVTGYYDEIQKIAHAEANRLRSEGYDDNSDEIQELQKTWWDAEKSKLDFYSKQHENIIRDIEHARDMALNADENANVNAYYKQLQEEYHREAERLRALDPEKYKEDIQKLQQLWWDAQNEMLDYNKQVIDDFFSKLQEELDKSFDIRISRLNSKSSLLSSHFKIVNAIAEEQHNLNKELREAETIGAKMSELERETLFSKADHNKLSSKLSDIMLDITDLQSDYLSDLERATEDTIEEVTNQYERQYELKMKEYEIVKAELNLIRKQQILENTQNEKSVRTWNGSQWVYEANLQDVLSAQEEVENAKYELAKAQSEEAQQTALNAIDASADALQTEKNKLTTAIEDMAESMSGSGKEITDMLQTIAETDLPTFDAIIKAFGDSIKEAANISDKDISKYRPDSVVLNRMKSRSDAWHTASAPEKEALAEANRIDGERLGLTRDASGVWRKKDGSRAYASGTPNAKKGIGLFDEKGFGSEVILTNDGILTQFNGGERVFSPEMADRLWEMAQKNNIFATSVPKLDFAKLVPIEDRINNAISNISNSFGDTYMIKDVQLSESEGGTLKGFINFLKKKI